MHQFKELPAALTALLPRLRARARRLVSSASDAEDLLQDTVLILWQSLGTHHRIGALDRYAMTILANLARKHWRMGQAMEPLEDHVARIDPDAPRRIACTELAEAIARLPQNQRVLMERVAAGETSPAALASTTGVRTGTVMSRLARARAQLRAELGLRKTGSIMELF